MSLALFLGAYWLFVLLYFLVIQKPLFILANHKAASAPIDFKALKGIYGHGVRTDAIIASYVTAPVVIMSLFRAGTLIAVYNVAMALVIGLITMADAILYGFWNYKLDASALSYVKMPKKGAGNGVFKSVSVTYAVLAVASILIPAAIFLAGTYGIQRLWLASAPTSNLGAGIVFVLAAAFLFVNIRGLGIRPNNPAIAYFSKEQFFNHCALNPAYSFLYSLTSSSKKKESYRFYDPAESGRIVQENFPTEGRTVLPLLTTSRPNIALIIWESFGAEFTGRDVTPRFDKLCGEGVLWSRCAAGSFRTDRALPCILSGTPALPVGSIIRNTEKLTKLPGLPRTLKSLGYETMAIHGGDMTIMNKNAYYLACGHDTLIAEADFDKSCDRGKWGVHDGSAFDRLYDELTAPGGPRFITLQTLSSHEPFDVPYSRLDDKIDNSMAYTDSALGRFIDRIKQSPAWDNTLIIIVADHGFNRCHQPADRVGYSHIPMLWLGGAVKTPAEIDVPVSQTDLAATLLGQMGVPHAEFRFSRDTTADTYRRPSALHTFNNGFLVTDLRGSTVHINVDNRTIEGPDPEREQIGKALLQELSTYINSL